MIKNWNKFNEGWFDKKEKESDLIPKGLMSSTGRPSSEESERIQKDLDKLSSKIEPRVDSDFMQEISDRLYGPDSEEYIKALKELNKSFQPRQGRYGSQLYDPSNYEEVNKRQQEVINKINNR
jgi:tetrahydromethanopterin S-methyltransferase subunit G